MKLQYSCILQITYKTSSSPNTNKKTRLAQAVEYIHSYSRVKISFSVKQWWSHISNNNFTAVVSSASGCYERLFSSFGWAICFLFPLSQKSKVLKYSVTVCVWVWVCVRKAKGSDVEIWFCSCFVDKRTLHVCVCANMILNYRL